MQCTSPTWVKDQQMYVPCGWCVECLIRRRAEWATRMMHEAHYWPAKSFCTLTYREDVLPRSATNPLWPTLRSEHIILWLKRLRKYISPRRMRYYVCGEYGPGTCRPHYHAILYGIDYIEDRQAIVDTWPYCDWAVDHILHQSISDVTVDRCLYVAQYVLKKIRSRDDDEYAPTGREAPFRRQSQGLGLRYAMDNREQILQRGRITVRGVPQSVPRYYLRKLGIDASELCSDHAIEAECEESYKLIGLHMTEDEIYNTGDIGLYDAFMRRKIARNERRRANKQARLDWLDQLKSNGI